MRMLILKFIANQSKLSNKNDDLLLNETSLLSSINLTNYREQMIESILNNLKKYNDENIKLINASHHFKFTPTDME